MNDQINRQNLQEDRANIQIERGNVAAAGEFEELGSEQRQRNEAFIQGAMLRRQELLANRRSLGRSDSKYMERVKAAIRVLNDMLLCPVPTEPGHLTNHAAAIEQHYQALIDACKKYRSEYAGKNNRRMTLTEEILNSAERERRVVRESLERWGAQNGGQAGVNAVSVVRDIYLQNIDEQALDTERIGDDGMAIEEAKANAAMTRLGAVTGSANLYETNEVVNLRDGNRARQVLTTKKSDKQYITMRELLTANNIDTTSYDPYAQSGGADRIEYTPEAIVSLRTMRLIDVLAGITDRKDEDILVEIENEGSVKRIKSVKAKNMAGAFKKKGAQNITAADVKPAGVLIDNAVANAIMALNAEVLKYLLGDLLTQEQLDETVIRLNLIKKDLSDGKTYHRCQGAALYEIAEGMLNLNAAAGRNIRSEKNGYVYVRLCTAKAPEYRTSQLSNRGREKIREMVDRRAEEHRNYDKSGQLVLQRNAGARSANPVIRDYAQDGIAKEQLAATKAFMTKKIMNRNTAGSKITEDQIKVEVNEINMRDQDLFEKYPSIYDIGQGDLGDCYFMSAIAAIVSRSPEDILNMMKDNGDGTVTVRLFKKDKNSRTGAGKPEYIIVKKSVFESECEINVGGETIKRTNRTGGRRALWVNILEKAFAMVRYEYDESNDIDKLTEFEADGDSEGFTVFSEKSLKMIESGLAANPMFTLTGNSSDLVAYASGKKITTIQGKAAVLRAGLSPRADTLADEVQLRAIKREEMPLTELVRLTGLNMDRGNSAEQLVGVLIKECLVEELVKAEKGVKEMLRADDIIDVIRNMKNWPSYDSSFAIRLRNKFKIKDAEFSAAVNKAVANAHSFFSTSEHNIWEYIGNEEGEEDNEQKHYTRKARDMFKYIEDALRAGKAVGFGTRVSEMTEDEKGLNGEKTMGGMVFTHAYTVLGTYKEGGRRMLIVHNPWAQNEVPTYKKIKAVGGREITVMRKAMIEKDADGNNVNKDGIFLLDANDLAYFTNTISTVNTGRAQQGRR